MRSLFVIIVYLSLCLAVTWVYAQDNGHTHDGEVGKFYQTWMIPPTRQSSCCNNVDCRRVEVRPRGAGWEYKGWNGNWYPIPSDKIESNLGDARDSPDGFSHVCSSMNDSTVYCAVIGAGL